RPPPRRNPRGRGAGWPAGGGLLAGGAGEDDEAEGFEVAVESEDLAETGPAGGDRGGGVGEAECDVAVLLEEPPRFSFDGFVDPADAEPAGFDAVVEHAPVGEGGVEAGAVAEAGGSFVDDVVGGDEPRPFGGQDPVPLGGGSGVLVGPAEQRDPG